MKPRSLPPWHVSRNATPDHTPQFSIYPRDCAHDIAIVIGPNAEADAQLIAAAPDLFDALDDCRGVLESIEDHLKGKSVAVTAVLQKAREAIAAATPDP